VGIAEGLRRHAAIPALLALLLLTVLPIGAGTASAASGTFASNCGVNVRSKPTTLSTIRVHIETSTLVTASAVVSGGAYATTCGKAIWGTTWLAISAIGGRSVRTSYGVTAIYAAAELFRAVSTSSSSSTPTHGAYLLGVDVSQWNGTIDFRRVRAASSSSPGRPPVA
jgi:hypothetical protein